nr:Ig-like domain-containing protein [Eubacterium sp.]
GAKCGKKLERIAEIKNGKAKSYTVKKLKKGTYYKYMLLAYKTTSKGDKVILVSKTVHVATNGGKIGNPTSIKLKKSKLNLKKGKKATIKASYKKKKKVKTHIGPFRYESENPKVATVTKKGKVKAVGKGKTNILVFTQNGICKKVKVTVK